MTHYDVIVIGSGAGGGTLVHRLAPSGKQVLLLERGDWLAARAAELVGDATSSSTTATSPPDTWYDERRQAVPAAGPLLRRRRHQALRRGAVPAARGGLRRARALRRHLARVAGRLRRVRAVLHAGRAALPGARRARRGPDRAARERALPAPAGQPRAAHPAALRRSRGGRACTRSTRRAASCSTSATCRTAAACAAPPATASRAWCTPSPTPRCWPCGRRWRIRNVTLLTSARALRLETNAAGTAVTGVVVERDGERETFTADIVVVSCGAANSAALLLTSANAAHPHGLANGSDQVGRNYMFHNSQAVLALSKEENPTIFQKTLGLNDFYFGTDGFEFPLGNIQMVGKSSADMYRGEKPLQTRLAPQWTLDRGRPPRGRLLALHRGPAAAGEPGHAAPRRAASSSTTGRPTRCPSSGCSPS